MSRKNKDKLSILMVAPYFYPEIGGLENYVYHVSRGLVRKGHDVTVLCSTKSKNKREAREEIDGISVIRQRPDFILSNTPIKFSLFFEMGRLLKKSHFDLIIAHSPVPYYADVAALISRAYKIPFVLTYYSGPLKKDRIFLDILASMYKNTLEKILFKSAKKIIAVSDYIKRGKLRKYAGKTAVISPGVDLNIFKPKMLNSGNKGKRFNMLFAAQLSKAHRLKGLDYLLKAFEIMQNRDNSDNIYLTIAGSGNYMKYYKKQANNSKKIIFKGSLSHKELAKEYQNCSVVIVPSCSDTESYSIVALEAMACSLPVIGTRCGGIPCIVRDGYNGLLVPPKDPEAIADAIDKLLNDNELAEKLGKNGFKEIKNFTWRNAVEKTEDIIAKIQQV